MNSRIRFSFILCIIIVLGTTAAAPAAEVTAVCDGSGTVHLRVRFWADELGTDWQGAVIERSVVGECGTGIVLNAEPLPLLPGYDLGDYEFEAPAPSLTTAYRYTVRGVDADGSLVDLVGLLDEAYRPTWFAVASCADEPLLMRGTLHATGRPYSLAIEFCAGSCWENCPGTATVGVPDLDAAEYEPYLDTGTVMEVYGAWDSFPPEVSWGCVNASRLVPVTSCSGSVPVETTTWGTLKADYR